MSARPTYVVETLWEDEEFVLSRRMAGKGSDSLLVSAPSSSHPTVETLKRLNHAYTLRDELDSTWAARPIALEDQGGRPTLLIEDPGGDVLARMVGKPWDLTPFLHVAIGLTVSIDRLHGHGLIHKDIKPSNILVNMDTRELRLTGFGIASRLPRERRAPVPPEVIAGTLAYMAPEQTGRMNRSIDARCDLYSLGVMLYQMLTGSLPFTASDPMEWVHCHVARMPVAPSERLQSIPAQVSHIVVKLLAKTAEERYQTAAGVERDLRRCLSEWELHGRIKAFALGQHDTPDRLLIPEKLYGREREVDILLASFDRIVNSGRPELVLVSGYSGIGKSAVVNELHKPLVPPRGLFASGKFDQYKRNIPYATLAQAFRTLVRSLLAKSDDDLETWREAFREALGPNGRLVTEIVPELSLIIGEQPELAELSPEAARGRFQLVIRRFIGVFAQPEHSLALFVDDLQWLDSATLDLMEDLLTHPDVKHLMLIGAYRDNEVDSTHPLMRKLQAMREAGALLQNIVLVPLTLKDLEQLIGDSLHRREQVRPLAALVHDKTTGNPFFAIQFLSALHEQGLLAFDNVEKRWSWDLHRIHAKGYTDNVADLMVSKLTRLLPETQNALKQLACLGSSTEFKMVCLVYQNSIEQMHSHLAEAVASGFVIPSADSYHFLHDRVREAAYCLIPEEQRAETHLRIGRLMAEHTPPEDLEERIFEIVNQLNRAPHLITSIAERERIAELNLLAGRRARVSTAYASALAYLNAGRGMLTDRTWNHNYDLVFSIEYLMAECEFLTADMAAAESRLFMLAERARSAHHIALAARLRLVFYDTLNRHDRAVEVLLDFARVRGMDWSPRPTEEEVLREYDHIWSLLGERQIEELVDLPLMTNPDVLDVVDVFTEAVAPTFRTDANLHARLICRMVVLSLEHGNSDGSCYAYVFLGMHAVSLGNYQAGSRFGKLGHDLVERCGLHRYQARTYLTYGNVITPWTRHLKTARDLARRGFDAANRIGDIQYASYGCNILTTYMFSAGDPLAEVQREAEAGLEFMTRYRSSFNIDTITVQLGLIRSLRGMTATFGSFNDERFDELRFEQGLASAPVLTGAAPYYWIRKLQARVFARDFGSAIEASLNAERSLSKSPQSLDVVDYHFYSALARAATCESATDDAPRQHFEALVAHSKQLETWVEHCPENFENRAALLGAEIARIEGREVDAQRLYEAAIRSARGNEFIHNEGLAYEFASRFYLARGFGDFGTHYLRRARHCYLQWGADGKVRQLDQLYPNLKEREAVLGPTGTIGTLVEQLDLATVMKILQAVSGEMVLEKLIDSLMRTAIEHAGAERGLFVLLREDELRIVAEATTDDCDGVIVSLKEASLAVVDLPESIVHFVARTREGLILGDASAEKSFFSDVYIRAHHARSILCLPLLNRGKLVGMLYLENNLAPHVFTPERIAVLKLLASQAAVSVENARLYKEAQQMDIYLKTAQALSHTGSFGFRPATGEVIWSDETYEIMECDRETPPTFELVLQRTHPDDLALVQEATDRATLNGTGIDFEHRLLMSDGTIKWVYVLANGVRDEAGNVEYVGALMDITARKQGEEALRKLQWELARVSRVMSMGELSASIAHEINQPLAAIAASSQASLNWLTQPAPNLEKLRKLARDVVSDVERASDIITRIRAMAAGQATEQTLLCLDDVIREVLLFLRHELEARGVAATHQPAFENPKVLGERTQLQQVIVNLTINAVQAMAQAHTTQPEINVHTFSVNPTTVCCSVEDNGPGIEPQNMSQLFDSFFTTKDTGMGMGLRICRSVIEAHGGRIGAENNFSKGGARFYFTLPIANADP